MWFPTATPVLLDQYCLLSRKYCWTRQWWRLDLTSHALDAILEVVWYFLASFVQIDFSRWCNAFYRCLILGQFFSCHCIKFLFFVSFFFLIKSTEFISFFLSPFLFLCIHLSLCLLIYLSVCLTLSISLAFSHSISPFLFSSFILSLLLSLYLLL